MTSRILVRLAVRRHMQGWRRPEYRQPYEQIRGHFLERLSRRPTHRVFPGADRCYWRHK